MSGMRWFYLLLAAIVVAGGTLALQRLCDLERSIYMEAVLAASVVLVFVSFLGFLAKLRE